MVSHQENNWGHAENPALIHPTSSDIKINKSDLTLYLIDFRRSILNKKKEGILIGLANTLLLFSVFLLQILNRLERFPV